MSDWTVSLVAIPYGLWVAWVGIQHFRDPAWFEPIVPEVIGNPRFWVYVSGAFEIILGIGVALPDCMNGPPKVDQRLLFSPIPIYVLLELLAPIVYV